MGDVAMVCTFITRIKTRLAYEFQAATLANACARKSVTAVIPLTKQPELNHVTHASSTGSSVT
jgi:hypothetical protein